MATHSPWNQEHNQSHQMTKQLFDATSRLVPRMFVFRIPLITTHTKYIILYSNIEHGMTYGAKYQLLNLNMQKFKLGDAEEPILNSAYKIGSR